MDKKAAIDIVQKYSNLVIQEFRAKMIVLYGSYAKDTARDDSDIDVAVVVDQLDGDILDAQKKLFKLRRDIDVRIEPVLLEETHDQSGFLREILSTGYVVYQEDKVQY